MVTSTSTDLVVMASMAGLLTWVAILCAGGAAAILIWYLVRKPALSSVTKVALLLGLGVLPLGTASTGNLAGFENMKTVEFCGSCHVMEPYTTDVRDPASTSLASLHGRNPMFGGNACYVCHSDYGMFGTIATKMAGAKHVLHYATTYRSMPIDEALTKMELYAPYPNDNCMQCHSTRLPGWEDIDDHAGLTEDLRTGVVSCASEGCHGPSHPFSKIGRPGWGKPAPGAPASSETTGGRP